MIRGRLESRILEIVRSLADRRVVWCGTRATDALPLRKLGRPKRIASQVAPLASELAGDTEQYCLESDIKRRVDLDQYDIDADQEVPAKAWKRQVLSDVTGRLVVAAYRPAEFLTAIPFCDPGVVAAFNFHLFQRQLEHKPWTDSLLRRLDASIPLLPMFCVQDTDTHRVKALLEAGPLVGRTNTSAGGSGVFLITKESDFIERAPTHRDEFITVSPFVKKSIPLNINACIYSDGSVRAFGVSFQLIGVRGVTRRPFGFCGSDFAAAGALATEDLEAVESITLRVGACLARIGYRGVFGIDLLLDVNGLAVVEINARFQGSTSLCAQICQALGIPDPTTEHIAAFIGLDPPQRVSVADQVRLVSSLRSSMPVAQLFHRNLLNHRIRIEAGPKPGDLLEFDALPDRSVWVETDAMTFRSLHHCAITEDGYTLLGPASALVNNPTIVSSVLRA